MRITATFADGKTIEIKNSKRAYAAAWRVTGTKGDGEAFGYTGFARDADLAPKSAKSEARVHTQRGGKIDKIEVVETIREE